MNERPTTDAPGLRGDADWAAERLVARQPVWRNSLLYLATCLLILGGFLVLTGLDPTPYEDNPVDFRSMKPGQYALTSALTEAETSQIKLAFLRAATPPRVAVFGHHVVQGMGVGGLPERYRPEEFFNYYLTHLSLRETRDMLRLAEQAGKLPSELLLVHISHPYFGTRLAVGHSWEMPFWFYWQTLLNGTDGLFDRIAFLSEGLMARLGLRWDWKHLGYALLNAAYGGCDIYRIYSSERQIGAAEPLALAGLARRLGLSYVADKVTAAHDLHCVIEKPSGLARDGTFVGPPSHPRVFDVDAKLNLTGVNGRGLWTLETVTAIQELAREIDEMAGRNGARVVFFLAPRMMKYVPGAGHELADQLVEEMRAEGLAILDYRRDQNAAYFRDGIHLNDRFLSRVMADLPAPNLEPQRVQK